MRKGNKINSITLIQIQLVFKLHIEYHFNSDISPDSPIEYLIHSP